MNSKYLPFIDTATIKKVIAAGISGELYDLLIQPLHEELYRRGSFEFLDDLSWGQQLLLAYDYVNTHVGQGGFIQFLHNGYVGLLPSMIEQLYKLNAPEMALVLDDVLKVYVLNRDLLEQAKSVKEFAQLYDELKEFEGIDERFNKLNEHTIIQMLDYASSHLDEFAVQI